MTSRFNVLLITKEDTTANIVSSTLDSSQRIDLAGVCQDFSELRASLSRTATQAVVVDIDQGPLRVLRDLSTVVAAHPEARVVVVSSRVTKELILEAMQAGARHFLRKESIASELDQVLERLLCEEAKRDVALGSIISVFSASGGCGATTVALNLANELRLASSESVLVIDLDTCYGTVSNYLEITGHYGIADVLGHKVQIDRELIESSACNYMDDFHVLLSPASIEAHQARSLQCENLTEALEACKQAYEYTVIDAPRVAESIAANLAAVSKFALVVFQLTVKDLRFARLLVSILTRSGISPTRIIPLANRVKKRGPLVRLEDGKRAIGLDSFHHIRSDWRKAMRSVNCGKLLAQVVGRSGLRGDFQKLAAKIHGCKTNGNGAIAEA